jgi:hypothetical protein
VLIQPEAGYVIPVARHGGISGQSKETPLNLRIRKEQAISFRFRSLVRQLKDKDGHISENEEEPRQTEEKRTQKACEVINLANEKRQARLDEVMTEVNEKKSKMTPLPNSPQQIERRKREDLKQNKARQVRRSKAQRIRQTPERPCMRMEFEKLAYLGEPMQAIIQCRKCPAIPHASGESCLWRPSVDLMEAARTTMRKSQHFGATQNHHSQPYTKKRKQIQSTNASLANAQTEVNT